MEIQREQWNQIYRDRGSQKPKYDDWLEKYRDYLDGSKDTPIIDLGCGIGNCTLYLHECGFQVVSCDYAEEALRRLSHFITAPTTELFDLRDRFPFQDSVAKVVIADLCLHYFSQAETMKMLTEIRRVLKERGVLLCRVNSVRDVLHGAGEGLEIEANYYENNGERKRFFDEAAIRKFFTGWELLYLNEYEMNRYKKPKILWEVAVRK